MYLASTMPLRFVALLILYFGLGIEVYGQAVSPVHGAVLRKASSVRLAGVTVLNKRTNSTVRTNSLGLFSIMALPADTISFSVLGYLKKNIVLKDLQDQIVYLQQSSEIAEVTIRATSMKDELKEVENSFRKKGIYYKGKPPLRLLLPVGGSPLTFFHELLSKDGKRARRWSKYADQQLAFYKVASRFNDLTIKRVVPIGDDELLDFKDQFWPKPEQVSVWNDVELYAYIKESYLKFKSAKSVSVP